MAVKTWDTSRVGGGTYELQRDATTGNYSLKSVGFDQVNKLNLPDLLTQDKTTTTTTKTDTTKTDTTTDTASPYKQLAQANLGDDTQQDYGSMLKTPKVKEATVRQAGDAMTSDAKETRQKFDQSVKDLQDAATVEYNEAQIAKLNAEGASPQIMAQAQARLDKARANEYDMYRTGISGKPTGNFYPDAITRGQVGVQSPQRTTGLQKIKPTLEKVKTKIQPAILIAGKVLGGMLQAITPERTATQQVNIDHFDIRPGDTTGQRIGGNPAEDLYAGMNRNSAFGNLEKAGNKRLNTRRATIAKRAKAGRPVSQKFIDDTKKMEQQQRDYQKAKEKKTSSNREKAIMNQPGGGGNDSGGTDSGRVICTELHRTKEMTTHDWIRDIKFTYKNLSKDHIKGYLFWAVPTVKHIQKYPTYRKIWKHLAQHRANDIAWRLNQGKFDLLGRIYAGIGEPLCWLIGKCVSDKQLKELKLNSWRRA